MLGESGVDWPNGPRAARWADRNVSTRCPLKEPAIQRIIQESQATSALAQLIVCADQEFLLIKMQESMQVAASRRRD